VHHELLLCVLLCTRGGSHDRRAEAIYNVQATAGKNVGTQGRVGEKPSRGVNILEPRRSVRVRGICHQEDDWDDPGLEKEISRAIS